MVENNASKLKQEIKLSSDFVAYGSTAGLTEGQMNSIKYRY